MASQINLGKYAKTITALIGAGVTIAAQYLAPQLVADAVLVLTALGVYVVPNSPSA